MITDGLTEDLFEYTADVIVVGSGAAGCAAAAKAAMDGAEVLMMEWAETLGGTTALSGAGAWIPNNSLMRAEGVEDPRDPALRYMAQLAYPQLYDPESPTLGLPADNYALIETFYDRGSEALDDLLASGAAAFYADMALPDYFAELPDNAAPYGRKISPPERKASHDAAGPALIARMSGFAIERGARVLPEHRVVSLLRNRDGEVVGVEVRNRLRSLLARARKAVVFATGGFLHDPDLRREFLIGPTYGGCAVNTAAGDFVRIGSSVGAQLANMGQAWWYQVVLDHAAGHGHTAGGLFMPFGDSMIQVNRFGDRVMNEKAPYNERGPVHFAWDGNEYRNLVLFALYDDDVARSEDPIGFRWPIPMPGTNVDYVVSGDDLDDLARNVAERLHRYRSVTGGLQLAPDWAERTRRTIDRFNEFAAKGVDDDFGRGEAAISHYWSGTPREGTKATMHPFRDEGPYHCLLLVAGALDTKGGPKINTKSQVVDTANQPIPGLYGAGNCIASPAGQSYWGGGATIGCALVFGWIAGLGAAAEADKAL